MITNLPCKTILVQPIIFIIQCLSNFTELYIRDKYDNFARTSTQFRGKIIYLQNYICNGMYNLQIASIEFIVLNKSQLETKCYLN